MILRGWSGFGANMPDTKMLKNRGIWGEREISKNKNGQGYVKAMSRFGTKKKKCQDRVKETQKKGMKHCSVCVLRYKK